VHLVEVKCFDDRGPEQRPEQRLTLFSRLFFLWKSLVCCLAKSDRFHQVSAEPDLCCIVTRRLVELAGGVFDPVQLKWYLSISGVCTDCRK